MKVIVSTYYYVKSKPELPLIDKTSSSSPNKRDPIISYYSSEGFGIRFREGTLWGAAPM